MNNEKLKLKLDPGGMMNLTEEINTFQSTHSEKYLILAY